MLYPEPTLYAIPFFLVTLVLEVFLLARMKRAGKDVLGYQTKDALASLAMGIGSVLFVGLINLGTFFLAGVLYRHRVVDVGHGPVAWAIAMIGWDFSFYWHHRVEHENRLLWACHVNHHSSRFYNLSTALRQPWTPLPTVLFYAPWALVGIEPWMIMVSGGVNLIYQYWIHTEAIGKLPRPFEAIFNTPSHHRVHHGSNPEYLDKNYGGILIVWDRLFGTFEEERARVVYGLTKNIDTYNPFRIAAIARDVRDARGLGEKLGVLWHGPAWRAPSLSARDAVTDPR